ncbi:MAG: hypothetical protein ACI4OL_00035 [Gemmiger sp.]
MKKFRFLAVAAATLLLAMLGACPTFAQEYETLLDQLDRLQNLAQAYTAQQGEGDVIQLTLSYTRVGEYNSDIWQMTAGTRDAGFEGYVAANDSELANLQGVQSVTLPNGQAIDFGHLLASMNLVYNGIPISGSWGGDCMQLAQTCAGQASDAQGYMEAMRGTFGMADDGTYSRFGDQDLRADLDSVVVGSMLDENTSIAATLRTYYDGLTDYTRCHDFIALSFGTVDTGNTDNFRNTVYSALVNDTGMQLLLCINGMWSSDGWNIAPEAEAPMQGAAYLFADYLAAAVNREKVRSDSGTLMVTMAGQALADALGALGYEDAAEAAESHYSGTSDAQSASGTGSAVSGALDGATETLRGTFNVNVFRIVLLVLGALALALLIGCVVVLIRHRE